MPTPCFKKAKGGVSVKTFTGDRRERVTCAVGTRQDLRHFVRVQNLLVYQTEIKCTARITTDQRIIRFAPLNSKVTEQEWQDECTLESFDDRAASRHTFSNVSVLSAPPYGEKQEIVVDLHIERWQRGDTESASLSITVQS
ncbi:MAG: hypothetical protein JOZ96_24955 [Acidobacteria bacterium]|nr:hypothetical protein [Acidobacteriota bacterium]